MGRLNESPIIIISHFSHPHPLRLTAATYPPAAGGALCSGCALPAATAAAYSCSPCNFHLHLSCACLPPLLVHTCDPAHGLALLARSPYPNGRYTCDACALTGGSFVYHCAACGIDLHTRCARAPATVSHPAHEQHALTLAFRAPYGEGKGFTCDVCGRGGSPREWMYRCAACEFDVHLACGSGVAAAAATAYDGGYGGARGAAAAAGSGGGGGSFVGRMTQEIAVGLVQGIMGGGGGGSGGGGDGGGPGGAGFVVDMGREIIGGIFAGSDSGE